MITFRVLREKHGWAVRIGESMTTPFWSRPHAIREAGGMAAEIRRHGVVAEVLIEDAVSHGVTAEVLIEDAVSKEAEVADASGIRGRA
jgi:hypothetical protein